MEYIQYVLCFPDHPKLHKNKIKIIEYEFECRICKCDIVMAGEERLQ